MNAAPDPRGFTYDGAGNIATDVRSGVTYAYTYNNANRLKTVSQSGNLLGTYTYNGFEQLISRVITNSGTANGTVYTVHDIFGNVIAEMDGTGATVREYIWLPESEISPTRGSRTTVDRPLAVVSNVNTTPALLMVHVDQLNRPVKMTNSTGTIVWNAVWQPFGGAHTLTGAEALTARFPGQWFQLEAGLHYNWHRHYDPSLGRYTQPDPLGFVDGPSVFAYVGSSPLLFTDFPGLQSKKYPEPPFSENQCVYIPPPPGDCSPGQHRELQDAIDWSCQNISCTIDDTDLQLFARRAKAKYCAEKRNDINVKCYRGGDKNHRRARYDAWQSFSYCDYLLTRRGF